MNLKPQIVALDQPPCSIF